MIAPAVSHAVASTQTTVKDYSTYKSLHAKPMAHQSRGLNTASEQYSCPQSEPLRRKVYEGQRHFCHPVSITTYELSNSDDDFTNDQHDQHCQQVASGTASESQLRKRVIIETLQGLKQSLQNQSAALERGCLQPP
ncbi:hypothetical protein QAD02_024443 [Eretmocerus hayati]|uniref:Uncharacterized protein n=1 Tax=Eretmocerus hayati TaxID=131215 RepID=A0ACC2Q0C9_9HYME|nr:hypothetical protein QAD02_024443 [Eretmocerus hayati]